MLWNPNKLDSTDKSGMFEWKFKAEDHNAFNYEFAAWLSTEKTYPLNNLDEEQKGSLYRMFFHLLIEQMPLKAYDELFDNLRYMYDYYIELEEIHVPETKLLEAIPAQLGKKYIRESFTISE